MNAYKMRCLEEISIQVNLNDSNIRTHICED
jgi:hypothetical protein